MKRKCLIIAILAALLLLLTACGSGNQAKSYDLTVDVYVDGNELRIQFDDDSFSSGSIWEMSGTYKFEIKAQSDGNRFTLQYPDGYVYTRTERDGMIAITEGYTAEERKAKGFPDGGEVAQAIKRAAFTPQSDDANNGPAIVAAILVLLVGLWHLCAPASAWYLEWGWRYKDAEPSDIALTLYRVSGGVILIIGVIFLLSQLG